jgi:hypothetical protein
MPPLAALIPAIGGWGGLAKAGASLGTGLLGSKFGRTPGASPYESQALAQLAGIANMAGPYAQQFLRRAEQAYGPAQTYWSRILSGNRPAVMGALSPEIEAITGQQNQIRQMQGELTPRGGPGAAFMAQLPYQTAGQIGALMSQARSGAAGSLAQLAGSAGQLGLGALGQQRGAAGGVLDAALRQREFDLYRRQVEWERARALGSSVYGILKGLGGGKADIPTPPSPDEVEQFPGTGVPDMPYPGPPLLPWNPPDFRAPKPTWTPSPP